jgi:hypothetical protein
MKDGTTIYYTEFVSWKTIPGSTIQLHMTENGDMTEYYDTGRTYGDCFIEDKETLNKQDMPEKDICST